MNRIPIASLVLMAAMLVTGAFAQSPLLGESTDRSGDDHGARSPLKLTVKTDKSVYHVGDTVHVTMLLKNPTKKPVPVTYATGQKYEVFMLRPAVDKKPAEMVWQWSIGMMFTQMVTTTSYAAGQSVTYEVKYPPDDGTRPPALTKGTYTIKATITSMGSGPKPEAVVKFKVK